MKYTLRRPGYPLAQTDSWRQADILYAQGWKFCAPEEEAPASPPETLEKPVKKKKVKHDE